jgi:hypothetical protein
MRDRAPPLAPNHGWLAQLVERDLYTVDVGGSFPSPPTICPIRLLQQLSYTGK